MKQVVVEANASGTFFSVNEGTELKPDWFREKLPPEAFICLKITPERVEMKVLSTEAIEALSKSSLLK